jgi:hypothetical protein
VIYRGVKWRDLMGGKRIEEVGEVPLCWDCVIEMEVCEGRGRGESDALRKGLRRVERVKGMRLESNIKASCEFGRGS